MTVRNIIDRRKRPYRFDKVTAIIEPTWHDNSCRDSDRAEQREDLCSYDERAEISLAEAIMWATNEHGEMTLYLYDLGDGIAPQRGKR